MLTISKPLSAGQAQSYHQKEFTAKEQNYWSQRGEVAGEWQGRLAEKYQSFSAQEKSLPSQTCWSRLVAFSVSLHLAALRCRSPRDCASAIVILRGATDFLVFQWWYSGTFPETGGRYMWKPDSAASQNIPKTRRLDINKVREITRQNTGRVLDAGPDPVREEFEKLLELAQSQIEYAAGVGKRSVALLSAEFTDDGDTPISDAYVAYVQGLIRQIGIVLESEGFSVTYSPSNEFTASW